MDLIRNRQPAPGGRRLVVVGDDGTTYVGLVCLTSDRAHLCIDAECHAASAPQP